VGLAARAPLTMFDEAHLGMDAPTRRLFQEELLADYVEHPRTIPLGVIWHGRRTSIDPRRFVEARLVRHAARRNGG
jgi:hypothetical protein